MHIPISLSYNERGKVGTRSLIDCGAQGEFIDKDFAEKNGFPLARLEKPIIARNVDGTPNKRGTITHYTWANLQVDNVATKERLLAVGLGKENIILGLPWLKRINPDIDWVKGTLRIGERRGERRTLSAIIQQN